MPKNTGNLYLQLSANTDTYVRALKAAKASTQDFAGDVDAQISGVRDAFAKLGGADVNATARAMERSFRASFANIKSSAQEALTLPRNENGALAINLIGAEKAQADAERLAVALREIADAAASVVIGNDAASEAEKRNAIAAEADAQAAEARVAGIREEVGALRSLQTALDAAGASSVEAAGENEALAASHNRVGASGLIAEHVMRSFADSLVAGQDPARAFAMQLPRIGEAFTLMSLAGGESTTMLGRFASFMGGGWGIAITAAISLASVFGEKLFEMHDAAEQAKLGSDGLSDAQSVLGKMFDLTSGKLQHQNDLLRLNAQLTAVNLRAQAAQEKESSDKAFATGSTGSFITEGLNAMAVDGRGAAVLQLFGLNGTRAARNASERGVADLIQGVQSGKISPDEAIKRSAKLDYSGAGITGDQLRQAIVDAVQSKFKDQTADEIEKALTTNTLPEDLRRPGRPKKPKVDHSAEKAANADRAYQNEDRQASDAVSRAQADLANTIEARYQVQLAALRSDLSSREAAIQDEVAAKKITQPQADSLKAKLREAEQDQEILLARKKQSDLIQQQLERDQIEADGKKALLELASSLATTTQQRRDIALQLLAIDEGSLRRIQQATIDDPTKSPAQKADAQARLGQIDQQHAARVQVIDRQNAGPLASYAQQLHSNTDDMNAALQGVAVDGLKGLEDGLEGLISGTENVSQAFKKMASSIIADLARIAIEKAIVGALGGSFFGLKFADGGAVQAHADGGLISGAGGPRSDSILSWLSNGEFVMNASATSKYLPVLHAMNNNRMPHFADGGMVGNLRVPTMRDISRDEMQAVSRAGPIQNHYHITNSFVEQALWDRMHGIAQQQVNAAAPNIADHGADLASQRAAWSRGRQLGGSR